jgi:hypothetical protein
LERGLLPRLTISGKRFPLFLSSRDNVRVIFLKGALLRDPKNLFNADLKGNKLRAIIIHEEDVTDENAFKGLLRAAVALNTSKSKKTV